MLEHTKLRLPTQPSLASLPAEPSRTFRWPYALCNGAAALCCFAGAYQSLQMQTALGWWIAAAALVLVGRFLKPHG